MKKIFFLLLILSIILASCLPKPSKVDQKPTVTVASKPTITIGFVGPLSGDLASYGNPQLKAVKDVIEHYKKDFEIKLIPADDQCKIPSSYNEAFKLANLNVDFVIGHTCNYSTKAALPIYFKNNILCVTSSSTDTKINSEEKYNNFIRAIPNDYAQSNLLFDFIKSNKFNNVLVIYEKNIYAESIVNGIKTIDKHNANIQYLRFNTERKKLYPDNLNTEKISDFIKKAELIVYCGYYYDKFNFIYKYFTQKMKYKGFFIGTDGLHDKKLFDANTNYKNLYTINTDDYDQFEDVRKIVDYYKSVNKEEPGPFYERTYMATDMILRIIKNNPSILSLDPKAKLNYLEKYIKNNGIETIFGIRHFESNGDITENDFSIFKVNNSTFTRVKMSLSN